MAWSFTVAATVTIKHFFGAVGDEEQKGVEVAPNVKYHAASAWHLTDDVHKLQMASGVDRHQVNGATTARAVDDGRVGC